MKKQSKSILFLSIFFFVGITDAQDNQKENREVNQMTRYEKGLANFKKIDGESGVKVIDQLGKISPDLAKYVVEYPFGDIYDRPGLNLRDREIATIASLISLKAWPQLKVHIQAGLKCGLTKDEIKEIIIQMSVYAGFPAAITAMTTAQEVFVTSVDATGSANID